MLRIAAIAAIIAGGLAIAGNATASTKPSTTERHCVVEVTGVRNGVFVTRPEVCFASQTKAVVHAESISTDTAGPNPRDAIVGNQHHRGSLHVNLVQRVLGADRRDDLCRWSLVPDRRMEQQHRVFAPLLRKLSHHVLQFRELQRVVAPHPQRSELARADEQPGFMRTVRLTLLVLRCASASPPTCSLARIVVPARPRFRYLQLWVVSRLWRIRRRGQGVGIEIIAAMRNSWLTPGGIPKRSLSSISGMFDP